MNNYDNHGVNEFNELVHDPLFGVHDVDRYSGIFQVHPENVGTHTLDVQLMGSRIISKVHSSICPGQFDEGRFLHKALYHDIEEVFTGDVLRPTKYCDPEVKRLIDEYGSQVVMKVVDLTTYDIWAKAKDDTPEGILLKVVDLLTCARKAVIEVMTYHNDGFGPKLVEIEESMKSGYYCLRSSEVLESTTADYLISLLDGARKCLRGYIKHLESQEISARREVQLAQIDNG